MNQHRVCRNVRAGVCGLGLLLSAALQAGPQGLVEDPGAVASPEAWQQLLGGTPKESNVGKRSVLPMNAGANVKINFKFNSATVTPEWEGPLRQLATLLDQNQKLALKIEGHTDGRGLPEYNDKLSEKRAVAVKDFLVKYAPSAKDRLTAAGKGSHALLVADNPMDPRNRRVSFTVQ